MTPNCGTNASFVYDPLGRRIERIVNGQTTAYLYDGNQAIGEVRAGQTTAMLTGLAIDEAIARYASTGRLTQLTDQLGSVIKQINETGATQSQTTYSPYGEAQTTGDDQGNSTEYTGRENDKTGLYFYRARYFDPILKRWISEDPIGTAGGINLMGYVGGNPVNFIDPLGLAGGARGGSYGSPYGTSRVQMGGKLPSINPRTNQRNQELLEKISDLLDPSTNSDASFYPPDRTDQICELYRCRRPPTPGQCTGQPEYDIVKGPIMTAPGSTACVCIQQKTITYPVDWSGNAR